ncbi:MAG TPA: hypothetical protein VMW19_23385 [Myxococcota bacterium]|nr:hypothetical protein [Myxococcota bacterium]
MSTQDDRILIHRLAAGELDALEGERARALIERDPELALLLEQLNDLQSRVQAAFPEPPQLGERPAFVEAMRRLSAEGAEPYGSVDLEGPLRAPGARRVATSSAPRSSLMSRLRSLASVDLTSYGGDEPSPGAHLFHLREIRREEGLPVELEFYAGDVLALHSEVLLVSAFSGWYQPTPGSLFGSIAERYGISFASGPPPGATRYPEGLLHFSGIACPAFDSLWIVEMREAGRPFSVEELRTTLRSVGSRLPHMLAEATSITLPLLGTGNQGLNPRDVARELLSALPEWARNQRLRTIRVFTLELEHVAALNRALDDRDFSVRDSALLMACDQLRRQLERRSWSEPVRMALKDLLEIASAPDPSLQSIALEGRRIAETVLRVLSREGDVQRRLLERGPDALRSESAYLATPHLQLLLAHGRSAAQGVAVGSNDAVMILYAAMRAAELTGTPNRPA